MKMLKKETRDVNIDRKSVMRGEEGYKNKSGEEEVDMRSIIIMLSDHSSFL
jgi:hypothetical protein